MNNLVDEPASPASVKQPPDAVHPDERRQWRVVGALGVVALVLGSLMLWAFGGDRLPGQGIQLPLLRQLSDFSLTERSGNAVALHDLQGKVWVADFIFTRCAGPCPVMTGRMAELYKDWAADSGVRFVTVTVDPEYDTPAVLADYAAKHGVEDDRWLFLTGAEEDIKQLAVHGFAVGSVEEPIFHSTKFVLVDRAGRIRGYYEGTEPSEVAKLDDDIRRLLRERVWR